MPQEAGTEVDVEEENWDTNRPADVYLPSPDRVDKVSRQWSIPGDAWQGSVEKARKGSRLAVASLAVVTKEGLSSLGLADAPAVAAEGRSRPGRKRKGVVYSMMWLVIIALFWGHASAMAVRASLFVECDADQGRREQPRAGVTRRLRQLKAGAR